jgi:transposase
MKQKIKNLEGSIFKQININAAGIDVGSKVSYVAVPEGRSYATVRKFECFTSDLYRMAKWLKECKIETVVMESTGVYWIPIFQILEEQGFEVKLVNARHIKNVPGRKTDTKDCQWLQQLHTYGLLNGSFRPSDEICVLRAYIRHRENIVKSSSPHIQRMQKAMIQMNIQLHKVISDITGVTGMAIIHAIVAGERDPLKLAKMKDPRIKSSESEIAESLIWCEKIAECDREIEMCMIKFESNDKSAKNNDRLKDFLNHKSKKKKRFNLSYHLLRITGVDFTKINGFDTLITQTIISEVGLDAGKWPTEKHFTSWLGLCPNHKITGEKVKSSKTRKVFNRAANAFRLAAQSAGNSKTYIGAYFRRMKARLGAPKAITATAHKLARIFYRILKYGEEYVDRGVDYYENQYRKRVVDNLKRRAKELGFTIISKEDNNKSDTEQATELALAQLSFN